MRLILRESINDTKDNDFIYNKNDFYPRDGLEVTNERIEEVYEKTQSDYDFESFTVAELKSYLDKKKVKYPKTAKKDDLLKLVGD